MPGSWPVMERTVHYKFKICLVGESAVGKTSLIRRLVFDIFHDKYLTTIGTKITKKELQVQSPSNKELVDVFLVIWDIMGQQGFRHLFKGRYFSGANGIIGVCDITRKETLTALAGWIKLIHNSVGELPTVILGNKCDLEGEVQMDLDDIGNFASNYKRAEALLTSAKTGENVEPAFKMLSEMILEHLH
jgi:small GTP-binding protein